MVLEVKFPIPKNLIVSSFLVLSNRRLQNHRLAKVEYVQSILCSCEIRDMRVREMIKNENEPIK